MLSVIKYIFLGLVQGLTEFLPVSSSAHLVIFQELFQIRENQLILDIVLHLGTLSALVVFLFKDLKRWLKKRIILYIFLATLVTAAVVVLGESFFESMFLSIKGLVFPLALTGLILLGTKKVSAPDNNQTAAAAQRHRTIDALNIADGLCLGLMQGAAVLPGLSRSGVTISTLLFRRVERETAFKFSFLASLPAILGALVFKLKDFSHLAPGQFRYILCGFFASFLSGLLALKILLAIIRKAQLYIFGYYCLALSLALFIFINVR